MKAELSAGELTTQLTGGKLLGVGDADANTVTEGGAAITTANADKEASNGVVHVIDAVLAPPDSVRFNVVQLAAATTDLSKLVEALKAATLDTTFSGDGK